MQEIAEIIANVLMDPTRRSKQCQGELLHLMLPYLGRNKEVLREVLHRMQRSDRPPSPIFDTLTLYSGNSPTRSAGSRARPSNGSSNAAK